MKLTKNTLNKLIREGLTEDWRDEVAGGSSRRVDPRDAPHQSRAGRELQLKWAAEEEGRAGAAEKDLLASLSKEQKELAEDTLGWWAKQIDETGRLSGLTGKDGSLQDGLWSDEVLTNPPPGFQLTEEHLEFVLEALKGWVLHGDDDRLLPEIKILIEKFKAILADDEPEKQPEPEAPPQKRSQLGAGEPDPRFAGLEFDEALQRYKEGKTMKLTKTTLNQLIREELNKIKEADSPWGPPYVEPHPRDAVPIEDPVEVEPEKIPIEDITFDQLRGKQVTVAASGGLGGDSSVLMSSEPRFEEWKSTVLRDYPGSTIIFNRWGRWSPGSGPWKDAAVKKRDIKAKELARWGSH